MEGKGRMGTLVAAPALVLAFTEPLALEGSCQLIRWTQRRLPASRGTQSGMLGSWACRMRHR